MLHQINDECVRLYVLLRCMRNSTFLVVRRIACTFGQNCLSLPGGKVEAGESCRQAAVREAHEELGITIDPADLIYTHTMHRRAERDVIVAVLFTVSRWTGDVINNEPHKHSDFTWISAGDLPHDLLPGHYFMLQACNNGQQFSEHGF